MSRRLRHSPEQIVRKLRQADELAADGKTADEIARQLNISTATFYKWRNQYGEMSVDDAKELRRLREENAKLKRLVADKELENLLVTSVSRAARTVCRVQQPERWCAGTRDLVAVTRLMTGSELSYRCSVRLLPNATLFSEPSSSNSCSQSSSTFESE